jgi:PilZ domain
MEELMDSPNRRAETRFEVRMPIRFRPITNPPSPEQSAESFNVSKHGLFFATNCPLRVGEQVEIYLRMPREISSNPVQMRWSARVVRIEPDGMVGKQGVGVRVESYAAVIERDCWIC